MGEIFADLPITVAALRHEIRAGRVQATMPAGKLLVTETWLIEWRAACRVHPNNRTLPLSEPRPDGIVVRREFCSADSRPGTPGDGRVCRRAIHTVRIRTTLSHLANCAIDLHSRHGGHAMIFQRWGCLFARPQIPSYQTCHKSG